MKHVQVFDWDNSFGTQIVLPCPCSFCAEIRAEKSDQIPAIVDNEVGGEGLAEAQSNQLSRQQRVEIAVERHGSGSTASSRNCAASQTSAHSSLQE
jgi:hypothetical protein